MAENEEATAGSIMQNKIVTVPQDAPIEVVLEKFSKEGCRDLVVLDRSGRYLGVIMALDLLGSVSPIMGVRGRKRLPCIECLVRGGASTAETLMTRRHITIHKDAPIEEVMRAMEKNRHPDLIVVDDRGMAIGQIEVCNVISLLRLVGRL
ncbi:MAG: CBS domain-containing protein [Methanomicrobiales archaeon]|nr:CBS domain-containing protein [Methanomicrobiales archaeon]MDI6875161.1 CBS domain-containing protein [Methanomicrobiales archaeon]